MEKRNILTSQKLKSKNYEDTSTRLMETEVVSLSPGKIDIDELEEPLIALGLCETRDEVINIMKKVDIDGNGTIEFEEFLLILKNAGKVLHYIG